MYKAIVFSRVSSQQQDLVQQTDEVLSEAIKSGYTREQIVFIEHKESAIKLDEEERIGLQQLKASIERYPIECVFVYEISRISRRPKIIYSIRDLLIDKRIQLVCVKPYIRLLDNDGKLSQTANIMFSLFASLSESEMMLKKERMRRGVDHARAMGRHAGGHVMYGYSTDKEHRYIINNAEAKVVKRIFDEYVNGSKSMRVLTRDLQEEGYFQGIKYLTAVQEVYNILHRECYCGRKNGVPAIISESLYDKSVEKRKSNELKVSHKDNMAMLKGLLRDADSGLLLSSNTAANMYYCKRCSGVAVGMHIIEPIIWEYCVRLHKQHVSIDKETARQSLMRKSQTDYRKVHTIVMKLYDIQHKIDKTEERLIMGKISESKADEIEKSLRDEARELNTRHKEIEDEIKSIDKELSQLAKKKDVKIEYDNINNEERYEITHSVLSKVMLRRLSRYILECTIYNKYDENVDTIKIHSSKKCVIS